MHDFCFSPMYSAMLVLMSVVAWATTGSTASLVAGGASSVIVGVCAYVSLNYWMNNKKKLVPTVVISLIVSLAISYKMGTATLKDPSEHMLQAILCICSVCMASYYTWNLLMFAPQPAKASKPMDMQQLQAEATKYAQAKKAKQ